MVAACSREPAPAGAGPRFGAAPVAETARARVLAVHPLHNPARLLAAYQPLVEMLNARLRGDRLALEASRDYAAFEAKVRERKPEFILPNPWQALQAMERGYRVVAMAGEPGDFRGIFVVRRDSPLRRPEELRGASVAYPSRTALAACIMPQWFLHAHGIDVNRDLDNRYVGSQESAILNVHQRLTAAAATWPQPWRAFQREHPAEAAELKVLWETESLVNNAFMARDDLPAALVAEVRRLLLELDRSPEGRTVLAGMEIARFLPAEDADYQVVRRYVERFEREVRPVEAR
jgi:phosphonate transport system substrate-binding protein